MIFFLWFTELAFLTPVPIFIDIKIINATIASAAGTMFRQAHDARNTDDANKKNMRVAESIGEALTRFYYDQVKLPINVFVGV